jgi:hypothetical protein
MLCEVRVVDLMMLKMLSMACRPPEVVGKEHRLQEPLKSVPNGWAHLPDEPMRHHTTSDHHHHPILRLFNLVASHFDIEIYRLCDDMEQLSTDVVKDLAHGTLSPTFIS